MPYRFVLAMIIAWCALVIITVVVSPAFAYSNVSPKPGIPVPQKGTSVQKTCFTRFECIEAPFRTITPDNYRYRG